MKKLFFISLSILIIYSCSFSYDGTGNFLTDVQTINGKNYFFSAFTQHKNMEAMGAESFRVESKIIFQGLNKTIEMVISDSDFAQKMDRRNIKTMKVEKVSFSMNEDKNKIDLHYLINTGEQTETIVFTLLKDGDEWSIS